MKPKLFLLPQIEASSLVSALFSSLASVVTGGRGQQAELRAESLAAGEEEPGSHKEQQTVLHEFVTDNHFAVAAAAVEFYRAKGQALRGGDGQRALEHHDGERHQHKDEHQRRAADGNAKQQQQPTKDLEPRKSGSDGVQQKWLADELVLPH